MAVYKRGAKKSIVARMVRKGMRKAGQAIKKRYYAKGKVNVARLASDVAIVKRMINAEKKAISFNQNAIPIGQVIGNLDGYFAYDITPVLTQGNLGNQRNGDSVKMCSWHATMQVIQQSACTQRMNFKMYIFEQLGNPITSGTITPQVFSTNNFVGGGGAIIDYNSQLNTGNFGKQKLRYFKQFSIAPDNFTGQPGFKTLNFGGKLQHHIRYNGPLSTPCQNGQLWMVILCDSGNCSTTVASGLSNIPVGAINTGALINIHLRQYYYDN